MAARSPVKHIVSLLEVVREDLRVSEELSEVATFSAGRSPQKDCLAEDVSVDDGLGGVLETERFRQARQEEVNWGRGMGVWKPVLRRDMGAEGTEAVSLYWIDTGTSDADRTKLQVSIGRARGQGWSRGP